MIQDSWSEAALPSLNINLEKVITHSGSLTQYLQQRCSDFSVKVLGENDSLAELDELAILSLSSTVLVKIRTVYLYGQGQPLVYARTVIPFATWFDEDLRLYQLGDTPLGKILFAKDHPAARGGFQFAFLSKEYFSKYAIAPGEGFFSQGSLPARRSVFSWGERKLLIAEAFLPQFLSLVK